MTFILSIDTAVLDFIQTYIKNPFFDVLMPLITSIGDAGILWILIGAFLLLTKKYRGQYY